MCVHWLSSNLLWFASLNYKAFGNLFCNPQKSFHTSPESSDSNNRGCQPYFKLNNSIYKKKLRLAVKFFVNAIVEFEEWLRASIIRVGEVWKRFCGLQNKLRKAIIIIFITKDLNGPIDCWKKRPFLHVFLYKHHIHLWIQGPPPPVKKMLQRVKTKF